MGLQRRVTLLSAILLAILVITPVIFAIKFTDSFVKMQTGNWVSDERIIEYVQNTLRYMDTLSITVEETSGNTNPLFHNGVDVTARVRIYSANEIVTERWINCKDGYLRNLICLPTTLDW